MWKVVNLLFRFPLHFAYTRIHLKPRKRCNLGQKILDVRERVKSKQRRAIAQGKSGSAKAAKKRASNAYPEITFPSDFRDPDRANHADCSHATVTTPGCSTFSVTSFPPPFQKKPCPRRGKIRQKERKKERKNEGERRRRKEQGYREFQFRERKYTKDGDLLLFFNYSRVASSNKIWLPAGEILLEVKKRSNNSKRLWIVVSIVEWFN